VLERGITGNPPFRPFSLLLWDLITMSTSVSFTSFSRGALTLSVKRLSFSPQTTRSTFHSFSLRMGIRPLPARICLQPLESLPGCLHSLCFDEPDAAGNPQPQDFVFLVTYSIPLRFGSSQCSACAWSSNPKVFFFQLLDTQALTDF